jgi:hypothetical protein
MTCATCRRWRTYVICKYAAKVVFQAIPGFEPVIQHGAIFDEPASAVGLRLIECNVRTPGDLGDRPHIVMERRASNRTSYANDGTVYAQGKWLSHFFDNGIEYDVLSDIPIREISQKQGELIASKSGEHVGWFDQPAHPLGDRLQELIASRMSVNIIDFLEPVKVDESKKGSIARRPCRCDAILKAR